MCLYLAMGLLTKERESERHEVEVEFVISLECC
jgi:hypothetical protein